MPLLLPRYHELAHRQNGVLPVLSVLSVVLNFCAVVPACCVLLVLAADCYSLCWSGVANGTQKQPVRLDFRASLRYNSDDSPFQIQMDIQPSPVDSFSFYHLPVPMANDFPRHTLPIQIQFPLAQGRVD